MENNLDPKIQQLLETYWDVWDEHKFEEFIEQAVKLISAVNDRDALRNAICMLVWLFVNCKFCQHEDADVFFASFPNTVESIDSNLQPRQKPSEKDLPHMLQALEDFSKVLAEQYPDKKTQELRQPHVNIGMLDEAGTKQVIHRYREIAKESLESLQQTLQQFDPRSKVNVKSEARAWEKAANEYEGDAARILDYLRGQVCLTVCKVDSGEKLAERFNPILDRMKKEQYELVRLKEVLSDNLPRILLNF